MKKFTESLKTIMKEDKRILVYYDLFPLLGGLEKERPGIKDRVWKWMCNDFSEGGDSAFDPYNGRISYLNLFFYGIGEEYSVKYAEEYPDEVARSKKTFPEAFDENGFGDKNKIELRKDLNLIWSVYDSEMDEESIGKFAVLVNW